MDPSNGTIQTISEKEISINVIFRPSEMIAYQRMGNGMDFETTLKEADSLTYFVMQISAGNHEIENVFADQKGSLISYLSNEIASDISLIVDEERIPTHSVLFVPNFNTSKSTQLIFAFKTTLATREKDFSIYLKDSFFGIGNKEFYFDWDKIKKIPHLTL